LPGFDGGQVQKFILEVYDQQTGVLQANVTSPISHFVVDGLMAGRTLFMSIYAANTRGRSESANLEGFTLKKAEKQTGKFVNVDCLLNVNNLRITRYILLTSFFITYRGNVEIVHVFYREIIASFIYMDI